MNNKEILNETLNDINEKDELIVIIRSGEEDNQDIEFKSTETEIDKQISILELAKSVIIQDAIKEDA